MCFDERKKLQFGEKSYSGAPFIVYRSAKYVGVRERAFHALTTYGRFYVLNPVINRIRRILIPIQQIFAFLFIIATAPIFLLAFIGLYILRKIRSYLIRKYYPNSSICEDFSPRSFFEDDKTQGMITSIIWVKGHIDASTLRSHLQSRVSAGNLTILNKRLRTRLTLKVWEDSTVPIDMSKHVIQAPAKFYDRLITDETRDLSGGGFGGKSDKSVLEKYVTSRASEEMDKELPPWQISLVPLPLTFGHGSINKIRSSRTCVVLRFHKLLLERPEVFKMLVTSLGQSGGGLEMEVEFGIPGVQWISGINPEIEKKTEKLGIVCESRGWERQLLERKLIASVLNQYKCAISDLVVWYNLKKKQYEFHTKLFFVKSLWLELLKPFKSLQEIQKLQILEDVWSLVLQSCKVLRAISFIPLVIFQSFLEQNNRNGFQRNEKLNTRHVSWSKPISIDFLQEILKKTENASEESVLLVACSMALRDYYYENCIPNPKSVGVSVSSTSPSAKTPRRNKLLNLPTKFCDISTEINNVNKDLMSFPEWKQLGLSYLQKFSTHFLPRPLTFLVFQKLFKRYSINFNFIDTESPFPHLSLWGQTIDEFTFWSNTHSDLRVSISVVKYAGSVRLSVISPMKSVDSIISQRFSQHLNKIAESVGVEKCRIPYSRKSSPNSTLASSPDQKRTRIGFYKSNSLPENMDVPTKRYNSCHSLLNNLN